MTRIINLEEMRRLEQEKALFELRQAMVDDYEPFDVEEALAEPAFESDPSEYCCDQERGGGQ